MTSVTLNRATSAYTRKDNPKKAYGSNPSTLYVSNKTGKQRYAVLAFTLPSIVLQSDTVVTEAELVCKARSAFTGSSDLIFERVTTTKAWVAKKTTHNSADALAVADPITTTYSNPAAKTPIVTNVLPHLQAWRAGAPVNGWRVRTTDVNYRGIANNKNDVPTLRIVYFIAPKKPGAMTPHQQVVTEVKPKLIFQDVDPNDAAQTGVVVQINNADSGWTTPLFTSAVVPTSDTMVDLAAVAGAPSLGLPYPRLYWRCKQIAIGNSESPWSDVAWYEFAALGTLAITLPAAAPNNIVNDSTPPIGWTFSGTQTGYRVTVFKLGADPAAPPLFDSGQLTGSDDTITLPAGVISAPGVTYVVRVDVWDDQPRPLVDGMTQFVRAEREFTFELSNTVAPVTDLTHVDMAPLPFSKLTWDRSTVADAFAIVRDGAIAAVLDAIDVFVGGTSYAYIDELAAPRRPHVWSVLAIVDGVTSDSNPTVTGEIEPAGIWLSAPDDDEYITVITTSGQTANLSENGETFRPLNSKYGIRITSGLNGYEGSIVGELLATELTAAKTGAELRDDFLAAREQLNKRRILSMGDQSFAVIAYDMTISPTAHRGRNGDYVYPCGFNFMQVK